MNEYIPTKGKAPDLPPMKQSRKVRFVWVDEEGNETDITEWVTEMLKKSREPIFTKKAGTQ